VVADALGERADERWDAETAGELIVLLAAMAELKARLLLGEPVDEEPDPEALEARERLAARLIAYAPFSRAGAWLDRRARDSAGPRYRRVPVEGAPPPPRRGRHPRACGTRCALSSPPRRRRRSTTSPTAG
jgi:segregation and condensation protein A